ncbi:MAG: hypothetical protein GXN96_03165 [Aquificae bacterium]|nr:hypothetical protein [Aquificota bacterium]
MLRFLGVLILLITLTGTEAAEERGYCLQFLSSPQKQYAEKYFQRLVSANLPLLRIEKIKDFYVVRAGFFSSREEAKRYMKSLEKLKPLLVRCIYDESRVVKIAREGGPVQKTERTRGGGGYIKLSLGELGATDDIVLEGVSSSYSFFFPLLPELVEGKAVFLVRVPQEVPKGAQLLTFVNDIPRESYPIEGKLLRVEVPISPEKGRDFVKITLLFNLYDPDNPCNTLNDKLYAVILKESSFLVRVRRDGKELTVRDFLLDYRPSFRIVGRKPHDMAELSYNLALLYRKYNLYNLSFGSGKEIRLSGKTLSLERDYLVLPSDFFKEEFHLLTSRASIRETGPEPVKETGSFLFRELGFRTSTYQGWGKVSYGLTFYQSSASGGELFLRFSYGVPSGGSSWISILLNDQLIWYKELEGPHKRKEKLIPIPQAVLRKGANFLSIVFSYFPEEGMCRGSLPRAVFTLYEDSAIILRGAGEPPGKVREYLSSMEGRVGLYVGEDFPTDLLIEFFKNLAYLNPRVKEIVPLSDPRELPPEVKYAVVVDRFENLNYGKFPIMYHKGLRIYDPSTGKVLWDSEGSYDFILLEVGKLSGKSVLFFGISGSPPPEAGEFLNQKYLFRMEGNAAILHREGVFNFSLPGKQRVEYEEEEALLAYLERYRYHLLTGILVLLTFLAILLWRKNR